MLRRHPGRVLAVVGCFAMAGSIVGNAILFQSGRHPAPLFGRASSAGQPADQAAQTIPIPAPRPVSASQPTHPAEAPPIDRKPESDTPVSPPVPKAAVGGTGAIHPASARAPATRRHDAIAQLLRGSDKPPPAPDVDPHVAAAQKALEKLGFAVKSDGRMGISTRQALEKFQRDHHLPAGDALSPKLLRELATAAGLPPG